MRRQVLLALTACVLTSCSMVLKPMFDVADLRVEKKNNGYLIQLEATKDVGEVTAFITRDNWLVITIVGGTVDFNRIRALEPNDLVSAFQVVGYRTSIQLTLKLKEEFKSCEVVRGQSNDGISVALFAK